jgi:hypothetical protein
LPHHDPLPVNIELSVTSDVRPTYFIHDSFDSKTAKIHTIFLVGEYVACLIKMDGASVQAFILLPVFRFVRDRK